MNGLSSDSNHLFAVHACVTSCRQCHMHATCIKIVAKYAEAQLNKATTTSFDLPPVSLFGRLGRWPETDLKENRCSVSPSLKRLGLSSPSQPHCCDAQRRWSLMASLLGICRQIRRRDSFMLVLFFFLVRTAHVQEQNT